MAAMSRMLPLTGVPGKITRRLAAMTLLGLAMTVLLGALVARQLEVAAGDPDGRATPYLVAGGVLALLCLLAVGQLRRPWGITLGWLLIGLTLAGGVVLRPMAVVAVMFGALWVLCLTQGYKVDHTPGYFSQDEPAP